MSLYQLRETKLQSDQIRSLSIIWIRICHFLKNLNHFKVPKEQSANGTELCVPRDEWYLYEQSSSGSRPEMIASRSSSLWSYPATSEAGEISNQGICE